MQIVRRIRALARQTRWGLCCAAAVLVSCGGGTSQIEPFVPRQIIILGDQTSLVLPDGRRFGVNGLTATNTIDCGAQATWAQAVVGNFDLVLDNCNSGPPSSARGITRGAPNAKVADLEAQINAQLAAGTPSSKDLFLLLIGLNDIIEVYEQFTGPRQCNLDSRNNPAMEEEVAQRGRLVAAQINRLVAANVRVIVSTMYDVGLTPYARAKNAVTPGDAELLTCLTAAFNARVRVDIVQDGRFIGLVLGDNLSQVMVRSPGSFVLSNVTDGMCAVAVPDCTTATLVAGATTETHLWADDRHLGPKAHLQLANLAITRARDNPF
jgi:outer membrane lipase/esterase